METSASRTASKCVAADGSTMLPGSLVQELCRTSKQNVSMEEVKEQVQSASNLTLQRALIPLLTSWAKLRDDLQKRESEVHKLKKMNIAVQKNLNEEREAGAFLVSEMERLASKCEEVNNALLSANSTEIQLKETIHILEMDKVALASQLKSTFMELQAVLRSLREAEAALRNTLGVDLESRLSAVLDQALTRGCPLQHLVRNVVATEDVVVDPCVHELLSVFLHWVQKLSHEGPEAVRRPSEVCDSMARTPEHCINGKSQHVHLNSCADKNLAESCTPKQASPHQVQVDAPRTFQGAVHQEQIESCRDKQQIHQGDGWYFDAVGNSDNINPQVRVESEGIVDAGLRLLLNETRAAMDVLSAARGPIGLGVRIPMAALRLYFGLSWRVVSSLTTALLSFI